MPTTLTLRQLDERVFPSYPQVSRYFPGKAIEDARSRLSRAIERGDGPGLIVGGPGTGKSLLLQVLASQFQERFDVVLPACARLCTRRALLQSILFELGLPYRSRDEGELRLKLLDHLLSKEDCPSGLLLLVDEAQTLSIALLDELRVLTNLVRGTTPRVRLVLAGSSLLEEYFADPQLESFSQRLSARCYLGPFNREETIQFVRAQLAASRVAPDEVFSADACVAVFEATDGVPRLVNQLCDRVLSDALDQHREQINRQLIQSAWSNLQQLPTPWDTPETASASSGSQVIEFGTLSNEPANSGTSEQLEENDVIISARFTDFDTELDTEDVSVKEMVAGATACKNSQKTERPQMSSSDPFAERFDEEEVVLDNFAAWDNVFRHNTPRVANRRDPEFATLVGAAIQTAPAADSSHACRAADWSFEFDLQDIMFSKDELQTNITDSPVDEETIWPPLRIADLSDAPTATPLALPEFDGKPVLIVEDDAAPLAGPKSLVRREEYRNLFSRLRGT
jgi:type II secretory pathway predicted ATPase ExeA